MLFSGDDRVQDWRTERRRSKNWLESEAKRLPPVPKVLSRSVRSRTPVGVAKRYARVCAGRGRSSMMQRGCSGAVGIAITYKNRTRRPDHCQDHGFCDDSGVGGGGKRRETE